MLSLLINAIDIASMSFQASERLLSQSQIVLILLQVLVGLQESDDDLVAATLQVCTYVSVPYMVKHYWWGKIQANACLQNFCEIYKLTDHL